MATVKGVNKTLVDAGGVAKIANGFVDARVKLMTDTYEASALASGTTIKMGPELPAGAKIIDVIVGSDALNGAVTLDVGDGADPDRYHVLRAGSSATVTKSTLVDTIGYVVGTTSGDNQIQVINTGASAATGTITVAVLYTMD